MKKDTPLIILIIVSFITTILGISWLRLDNINNSNISIEPLLVTLISTCILVWGIDYFTKSKK